MLNPRTTHTMFVTTEEKAYLKKACEAAPPSREKDIILYLLERSGSFEGDFQFPENISSWIEAELVPFVKDAEFQADKERRYCALTVLHLAHRLGRLGGDISAEQ